MALTYPETKTVHQVDNYHGTKVADPYRWLEQSAETSEVRTWIEAQNALTFDFLASIPEREAIRKRLTELWDYPKRSAPFRRGNRYFQFRNSGLQNQAVLYTMDHPTDEGRMLLDPNTLSEDGTAALGGLSVSHDGRYLAYAVSQSGSDWQSWHIRDIASGHDLEDELDWSKFAGAEWHPDGSGFYYVRYPEPAEGEAYTGANENPALCFHRLGTAQQEDAVVYQRADKPKWMFGAELSHDGRYLMLSIYRSSEAKNLLYIRELGSGQEFQPLIDTWEAQYDVLGNDGETFYLLTDAEADRKQIIAMDLGSKTRHMLIPEREDTLDQALMVGDSFVCLYLQDASHRLRRYDLSGKHLDDIALPTLGSIIELNAERDHDELFYSFTSFLYPTSAYRYELSTGQSERLSAPEFDFNPEPFETRQVFVQSQDGTDVPLFLVHKRGLKLDGQNPGLLYGYGGFNVSLSPSFSVSRLLWLERGGVLAVANIRGGGEYGTSWHEAGTLARKQNVFDDFIACAEYLIEERLTSPKKLAVQGGSNGGLLVGAVMTQRPELFGAALPAVGVLDMLRFHKFTIGWAWASDYGSADDPEQFEALYAYSPLHNLEEGQSYPATLITTGDFDDRVVPAHSFKFAAALQKSQGGDAPVLIRIQTKAGHGAGKPTHMLIEEQADIWAFLLKVLA